MKKYKGLIVLIAITSIQEVTNIKNLYILKTSTKLLRVTYTFSELLFLNFLYKCGGQRPLSSGEDTRGHYLPALEAVPNTEELQNLPI